MHSFKYTSLVLLFCLVAQMLNAASITGHAPDLVGKRIVLFGYEDHITDRVFILDETRIDEEGQFRLECSNDDIIYVKLSVDRIAAHIYVEPGTDYEIEFPLPPETESRRFGKEAATEVIFNNLDLNDINSDIIDFNYNYEIFFSRNYETLKRLFSPRNTAIEPDSTARPTKRSHPINALLEDVAEFNSSMDSLYAGEDDPYFKKYRASVIGDLMLNSPMSSREIFDTYIAPFSLDLQHPGQCQFLEKFFKYYLVRNTYSFGEEALDSAINVNGSYQQLAELMSRDDFVADSELRELVMLTAIREVWNGKINRQQAIQIIDYIEQNGKTEQIQSCARSMRIQRTSNCKGFPLKDLEFTDQYNERRKVSDMKGSPLLVAIGTDDCTPCTEELGALIPIIDSYGRKFQVLEITVMEDNQLLNEAVVQERDHSHASLDMHAPILQDWAIASVPSFILIDENGLVVNEHTRSPSKGLERQIHDLTTEDASDQGPRIGRKDN